MKPLSTIQINPNIQLLALGADGGACEVRIPNTNRKAMVIFSFGGGWDHVSVSFSDRCPTWEEMCYIKDLFFEPEECAVQYHPAKKDYINIHPYCLHLWRPQHCEIPMPPKVMI